MNNLRDWIKWHIDLWRDAAPDWYVLYLTVCAIVFVIIMYISVI